MGAPNEQVTREELLALHEQFREVKHSVNNALAVVMALSELAERNPSHYEKLSKAVLTRGPDIVASLQQFGSLLAATAKGPEAAGGGQPAPTSGVF